MEIKDIVQIERLKNNRIKLSLGYGNETNIYSLLKEMGYGQTRLADKRVYFLRNKNGIQPTSILNIRDAFTDYLKTFPANKLPKGVSNNDLLVWYLQKLPIKQNALLKYILYEELNEIESHYLRMKIDSKYKKQFLTKSLIEQLICWNFNVTSDKIGSFSTESDLYYIKTKSNQFLVFNHFNKHNLALSGFDCWLTTYGTSKEIGIKKPQSSQSIKLCFKIGRDTHLIEDFIC